MLATRRNISDMLLILAAFLTLGGAIAFIVNARYWPRNRGVAFIDAINSTAPLILIPLVLLAIAVVGYRLAQCHDSMLRTFGIGSLWLGTVGMLLGSASHAMGPLYLPSALALLAVSVLAVRGAIRPVA